MKKVIILMIALILFASSVYANDCMNFTSSSMLEEASMSGDAGWGFVKYAWNLTGLNIDYTDITGEAYLYVADNSIPGGQGIGIGMTPNQSVDLDGGVVATIVGQEIIGNNTNLAIGGSGTGWKSVNITNALKEINDTDENFTIMMHNPALTTAPTTYNEGGATTIYWIGVIPASDAQVQSSGGVNPPTLSICYSIMGSDNFEITANSTYWGADLQTFFANVNGTPYTTINGTIVTNLTIDSLFLHNVSVWGTNYSNNTPSSINVSTDLEVQLDYDNYFVNISISNELGSLNNFNITLNGTFFNTENGSVVTDTTKNAYYNISVHNMTAYFPFSEIVFINWWMFELNYTINTTVYNLNVTSYSDFGGTIINDFNVSAILLSNGTQTNVTTTVGSVKLQLVPNEDYNIIIDSNTYSQSNYSVNMDNVSKFLNATLSLDALTGIFNCNSTLNTTSINFSIRDEDNNHQLLSASVNGIVTLTDLLGVQKNLTFNHSSTQSFKLCINPANKFFYSDIFIEYEPISTLGYKERYYIENITLTNNTQFKTLYNFNTTTTSTVLQGTAADYDSENDFPNLITKLLRFYPAVNEWKLVQVDKTDEFGNFFFYIKERDTRYIIMFEENNLELKRTAELSFQCDVVTGLCEIKFLVPSSSTATASSDIAFDISFDEDTGLITVFWNDPTLKTSEVRVEITKNTPSGRNTLFNQTSTSQTGSFVYNATGQKGTLVIKAYSSSSEKAIKYIQIATEKLWEILDDNQAGGKFAAGFWGVGIILTSVGATLWAPTAALIGLFLGALIMFFITGFNFITTSFLVSLAIGIIIVMIKVKK